MSDLSRARTEQVNRQSTARLTKQQADDAVKAAETSQQTAVQALTNAQQTFKSQQADLDRLTAERAEAQTKLQAAQALSAPTAPAAPTGRSVGPPRRQAPAPNPPRRASTPTGMPTPAPATATPHGT